MQTVLGVEGLGRTQRSRKTGSHAGKLGGTGTVLRNGNSKLSMWHLARASLKEEAGFALWEEARLCAFDCHEKSYIIY